jgi:hypothetical protein
MRFPRPARPGPAGRLLRPRAPARRLHQPRPAALPRPPARENARGHDRRQISYDLRRLRAHQIIERIPRSRNYQVTTDGLTIALFLTPADPAAPDTWPRRAHQPRTTRPEPAPASRPRLPRRPDRPRPAGIPRRLTPTCSYHPQ